MNYLKYSGIYVLTPCVFCFLFGISVQWNLQAESVAHASATPKLIAGSVIKTKSAAHQLATSQNSNIYTEQDERAAWIIALRKMAESKNEQLDWRPTIGAFLSTLTGGLITLCVAIFTLRTNSKLELKKLEGDHAHKLELTATEAKLGISDRLLELRLKQLENFISPLRAFMKQSEGVTHKLHLQLSEDENLYRFCDSDGSRKKRLQIKIENQWHDFRLLDQLPRLKNDLRCKPLIDEIIRIGKQITNLISEKGGLALSELRNNVCEGNQIENITNCDNITLKTQNLPDTLGNYLAHYAIFTRINESTENNPFPPNSQKYGYYPREMDDLVEREYRSLLDDLRPYFETSTAMLNELKLRAESNIS